MQKPSHHILVCASFRTGGEPKGICHKKGSHEFLGYLESELADRGLDDVVVSSTGCLKVCDNGPALVVYPENVWYGNVESEDAIDTILDALEEGGVAEEYVIS
jgi:(2Fe-2S) ferredoxin